MEARSSHVGTTPATTAVVVVVDSLLAVLLLATERCGVAGVARL